MNIALVMLALSAYLYEPTLGLKRVIGTFLFTATSAAILYLWAIAIVKFQLRGWKRESQRVTSILLDSLSITWILWFGNASLAGVYGLYVWITIGNGMRYGQKYLYGTLIASLVGFCTVIFTVNFWSTHLALSVGLCLTLIVVPLYAAFLIRRVHESAQAANEASLAKSEFIATMSHEIRTPLHAIVSLVDLLGTTEVNPRQAEMIRLISVSSNSFLGLINQILDISKYETKRFRPHQELMDLHEPIANAVNVICPQAQAKGLSFSLYFAADIDNFLIGAPQHIEEIIINISGNAVKFTESGFVKIIVTKETESTEFEQVKIDVSDSGPGINDEFASKIFDAFSQADSGITRRYGGTGLGTTISKELVRLMNGSLEFTSEVDQGSVFSIRLPLRRGQHRTSTNSHFSLTFATSGLSPHTTPIVEYFKKLGVKIVDLSEGAREIFDPFIDAIIINVDNDPSSVDEIRRYVSNKFSDIGLQAIAYTNAAATEVLAKEGFLSVLTQSSCPQECWRVANMVASLRKSYVRKFKDAPVNKKLRVLIADDNLVNQSVFRIMMETCGYDCKVVGNGELALEELESDCYDVAVLDMHMPRIDGITVAKIYGFSRAGTNRAIPLIMLTADNRPEAVADAKAAGIARFLVRPIRPSVLFEAIAKVADLKKSAEFGSHSMAIEDTRSEPREVECKGDRLIDASILKELLDYMSPTDKRRFFEEFYHDALRYIASLEEADQANRMPFVRESMHALCGAARTVGAVRLAERARRVEYELSERLLTKNRHIQCDLNDDLQATWNELVKLAKFNSTLHMD